MMHFLDVKRLSKREADLEAYTIMQVYRHLPMAQFIECTKRIDELMRHGFELATAEYEARREQRGIHLVG